MASLPLGYSLLDESNKIKKPNNKTIRRKRKPVNSKKVTQFLNFMNSDENSDNENSNNNENEGTKSLANYSPISNPMLPKLPTDKKDNGYPDKNTTITPFDEDDEDENYDNTVDIEGFKSLDNSQQANNEYYKQYIQQSQSNNNQSSTLNNQYIPNYSMMNSNYSVGVNSGNPEKLMKKLNYMIHLLEEQQDEKTENITEELVLYLFLGVFVIFVCDSFTKVGKYKR